jgi:hypothetical protein
MVVVFTSMLLMMPAHAAKVVLGVDCSQLTPQAAQKLHMQTNLRASMILVGCGLVPGGKPKAGAKPLGPQSRLLSPDVNVITGPETWPHITQSESMVWSSDGMKVAVAYNDSRGRDDVPINLEGVSVSTDGGATWARLGPAGPFTGHGANFGDPVLVYDAALNTWFAGALAGGCGGQGIGLWSAANNDPTMWALGACAHTGAADDRESMWVDNNPASPFFGRVYISWNNFSLFSANIFVTHSDDGVTWSAPVQLNFGPFFVRNVQVTGSPDDGTVYVAGMNEGGGQFNPRTNMMYTSLDGGDTWVENTMGLPFAAAGNSLCTPTSYFPRIDPIWRQTGFGQPVGDAGGMVHYVYAGKGVNAGDAGDIYYTQSANFGATGTWSIPIVLNTDQAAGGTQSQWMPSISITDSGTLRAGWYDRRNTTDGQNYQYFGRESVDGGVTWGPDFSVSSVLIPQPEQPDPGIQACYAGDYNYHSAFGEKSYLTWTDGRVAITDPFGVDHFQQDVFFATLSP